MCIRDRTPAVVPAGEEAVVKGLFRQMLADAIKLMLKTAYQSGTVDRESFKVIVRKSVDKLLSAHEAEVQDTKCSIAGFMTEARKDKIRKLVEAYVKVHAVKKQ
eukprot:TRINITY_DN33429_c0_g1_i3.p3 TRINITY_DN33429_c0_g1~~TRINITY_DN33429_c0_g1_i3.p3  ORF type:complete len:104 (+),score=39.11 TRINITY_DN33429_c0_g1_i3:181-492(+)